MAEQAGKEMSKGQRELADNCFEESLCALPLLPAHGKFLSLATDKLAIALLDDLTSPTIWPYPYTSLSSRLIRGHSTAIPLAIILYSPNPISLAVPSRAFHQRITENEKVLRECFRPSKP